MKYGNVQDGVSLACPRSTVGRVFLCTPIVFSNVIIAKFTTAVFSVQAYMLLFK